MTRDAARRAAVRRATDRAGDPSPFALGLLLRRAHWRAAAVMSELARTGRISGERAAAAIAELGIDPEAPFALTH